MQYDTTSRVAGDYYQLRLYDYKIKATAMAQDFNVTATTNEYIETRFKIKKMQK